MINFKNYILLVLMQTKINKRIPVAKDIDYNQIGIIIKFLILKLIQLIKLMITTKISILQLKIRLILPRI